MRRKAPSPQSPADMPVIDAALFWAEKGVAVFPCRDKRPLTKNGFKDAVKDAEAVRKLFEFYGDSANMVGAAMGDVSGMFALDFDLYKGPEVDAYLQDLINRELLPETRVHKTARGGIHVFYNGDTLPNSSYPTDGVEVRGNGAYVIFPGGGAGYEVIKEGLTAAPKALLAFLANIKKEQSKDTVDGLKARILAAENYHDSIARLAARYAAMGWDMERVTASILSTLQSSVAAQPTHPRHERWRFLMNNEQGEFLRTITTAHRKYNPNAATQEFNENVDADLFARLRETASVAFHSESPTDREEPPPVKTVEDWAGAWPFEEEGYFAHAEHDLLSQRFIMHPILCEDESILIAAEPKAGKTAIALTVGLHVAVGRDLGTELRVAEPRGVLYFGLEGRRAIRLRIEAWKRRERELGNDVPDFIPFFVVERSKNLLHEAERSQLAAQIVAAGVWMKEQHGVDLGLVALDTLTKAMPGGDQNSVEDTSSVFDVVAKIRELGCTAAAMFIHHKARAGNIRGSTNIEADPDVITSVFKDQGNVIWSLDRARSVEEGSKWRFKLVSYNIGTSTQGFQIDAPVVEVVEGEAADKGMAMALEKERAIRYLIKTLSVGEHSLAVCQATLQDIGMAVMAKSMRRQAKPTMSSWNSVAAQEYYMDLVPVTGVVFPEASLSRVMKDGQLFAIRIV